MERLFVSANNYKGKHPTRFLCVRYGNVLGSRGSIVPLFVNQIKTGKKISVTDPMMTRFNITMNQALELIFRALKNGQSGDVFVPKLKAYRVGDIKDAIIELMKSKTETLRIPVREGEKFHESLISKDETRRMFDDGKDYLVLEKDSQDEKSLGARGLKKSELTEQYSSDKVELFNKDELKEILTKENLIPS